MIEAKFPCERCVHYNDHRSSDKPAIVCLCILEERKLRMDEMWQSCALCSLAGVHCKPLVPAEFVEIKVKALKEAEEVDQLLGHSDTASSISVEDETTQSTSLEIDTSPQQDRASVSPPPVSSLLNPSRQNYGQSMASIREAIIVPLLEQAQEKEMQLASLSRGSLTD